MKTMAVTAALMICFAAVYGYTRDKVKGRSLVFKALATGMAAFLGCYGTCTRGTLTGAIVTVGLVLCMAADVVLEIDFIKGIALFGAAHICYIVSWFRQCRPSLLTAGCFLTIYGLIFLLFHKDIGRLGQLKIPAFLYMALLSAMCALAVTMYLSLGTAESAATAAGAVCFVISDCIIGWRTVRQKTGIAYGAAILILYYAAVYLFGAAVYMGI